MLQSRWLLAPVVAALLVFAAACGDDSGDSNSSSTGSAANPTAGASTGAGSTGASTGSGATSGATGTVRVDEVSSVLDEVDSFRFNMTMKLDLGEMPDQSEEDAGSAALLMAMLGNVQVEGAYVAPDRFQASATFFGTDVETIQIGNQSWTNDGSGWVEDTDSSVSVDMGSPSDLFDFIPGEELEGAETSRETVNGLETTRYHFDEEALKNLAEESGELETFGEVDSMTLDMWLTDEGVPVKMLMVMSGSTEGTEMSMEVEYNLRDLNDPSITIESPL